MSRIGKQSITLPDKVSVNISGGGHVVVQGPKGKLEWDLPEGITAEQSDAIVSLRRASEDRKMRALHGTARSLVANMVQGVTGGYMRELEIQGVGFRAAVKGRTLDLSLGFSHPVLHPIPEGITVTVTENIIKVEGIDKHLVGQFSSDVRAYYPPEPYKGKGIRYRGEYVRRKTGKSVQ